MGSFVIQKIVSGAPLIDPTVMIGVIVAAMLYALATLLPLKS